MQPPAASLPSAARGCWLGRFCRVALRRFKEFPNLHSLQRIKPVAGESERGSDGADAPSPAPEAAGRPAAPARTDKQSLAQTPRGHCLVRPPPWVSRHQQPPGEPSCAGERMLSPLERVLSPLPVPRQSRRQVQCGDMDWGCWGASAEGHPWAGPHPQAGSSP